MISEDRFLGCIYGLAIGDALGYPNEFVKDISQIMSKNNGLGTVDFEASSKCPPGFYTDDTQMSLCIANALLKSDLRDYNIEEIMKNIADEFICWYDSDKSDRAPGSTCLKGCKNLKKGKHWSGSGVYDSKGCGTSMRTAPIGLVFHGYEGRLVEVAYDASVCTHDSETAASGGISTAYLVSLALKSVPHEEWTDKLCALHEINDETRDKVRQVTEVMGYTNHFKAMDILGEGWVAHEAVALALYCVLKNPFDYEKTVLMGANTKGDSDSIACIAGAISGAYNGIDAVPEKWVREVEDSDLLGKTALDLYKKSKSF